MDNTNKNSHVTEIEVESEVLTEKMGTVNDSCVALNIRTEPSIEAGIICSIIPGSKLVIEESESTEEWFKVCTEAGAEGFCMKEYVIVE